MVEWEKLGECNGCCSILRKCDEIIIRCDV